MSCSCLRVRRMRFGMEHEGNDAEALAHTLMTDYPDHAFEVAVRLRADALTNCNIVRAGFWDDVLAVLLANNP